VYQVGRKKDNHSYWLNKTPTYTTLCRFYFCRLTLHVSGVRLPSSGVFKNWHGGHWYVRSVKCIPY